MQVDGAKMNIPNWILPKKDTKESLKRTLAISVTMIVIGFVAIVISSFGETSQYSTICLLLMLLFYYISFLDDSNRARNKGWFC